MERRPRQRRLKLTPPRMTARYTCARRYAHIYVHVCTYVCMHVCMYDICAPEPARVGESCARSSSARVVVLSPYAVCALAFCAWCRVCAIDAGMRCSWRKSRRLMRRAPQRFRAPRRLPLPSRCVWTRARACAPFLKLCPFLFRAHSCSCSCSRSL